MQPMIDLRELTDGRRREIPLVAALSAFLYGFTLAHTIAAYFPGIGLAWWFYGLLLVVAWTGVTLPIRRDTDGTNVGRLMLGLVWLVAPTVIGSIAAVLHGGWGIDELLLRGVLPGAFLLGSFVMASSLGDACVLLLPLGEAEVEAEVEARRSSTGFHQLVTASFKGWILLALIGSGLVDAVITVPGAAVSRWTIGLGAAAGLAATLFTLYLGHMRQREWTYASDAEEHVVVSGRAGGQAVLSLAVGIGLLAAVIPANLSPIARHGMGGFFQWLTDRIAPLFVPGRRPSRGSGGDGFIDRLTEGLLSRFVGGDGAGEVAPGVSLVIGYMLTVVLIAGTAYVLWRFIRLMQLRGSEPEGGARYREGSLLKELIVWLWDRLRGLFRAVSSWADARARGGDGGTKRTRTRRRKEGRDDRTLGPALRIRALFARWLHQMARLGYPREGNETPYEYARRVTELRPDARAEVEETAAIYVKARYSPEQEVPVLERAYQALKASVSEALQAIRRKSADPR